MSIEANYGTEPYGNELTLERLAQRLEALERKNADLLHEVAALRESGAGRSGEPVAELEGQAGVAPPEGAEAEYGVKGTGRTGMWGSSSTRGWSGVYGQHTGSDGFGVVGDGKGQHDGVLGRNLDESAGSGVRGRHPFHGVVGESTSLDGGYGVEGTSQGGYGGLFWGNKGSLVLGQSGFTANPPTSGTYRKGALYFNEVGNLYLCTKSGTPGTWRKFQMVDP